ncbi:MAG: ribonuclease III domain-containing protein [Oscillospiraceae bacterium]|nr:ribonuclease III domain-containing protein [Oscillospiraceae bacterium]
MDNPGLLSPSTLAFMGDAVFGILVRSHLCQINRPAGDLHKLSVKLVNANAQALSFKLIEPMLTETEITFFKRGRNIHTSSVPKNSSLAQYHAATGLEALFGYLYLGEQTDRIDELFKVIWDDFCGNN